MMMKTHMAIGIFAILFFLPHVAHKLVFSLVVLVATLLPDIDSGFSTIGRFKFMRVFQVFTKHRGIIHSLTFCIFISILMAFYIPVFAFPFFLGYSLHLMADAWTVEGIRPFWPLRDVTAGKVRVGGPVESTIFFVFIILDLVFFGLLFV